MAETSTAKKTPAWAARRRVADPKNAFIAVRCTAADHAALQELAAEAGLSVGAFLRAVALNGPGPRAVRRPPVAKETLARILGELGKLGSNVNQLARAYHQTANLPAWAELAAMREDVAAMRAALMKALGRDDGGREGGA